MSVRSTPGPTTLEFELVPPSVTIVTMFVVVKVAGGGIKLVMVAGIGIKLVMVAGIGIDSVIDFEGNEPVNKLTCKRPEQGDRCNVNLKKAGKSLWEVRMHLR